MVYTLKPKNLKMVHINNTFVRICENKINDKP